MADALEKRDEESTSASVVRPSNAYSKRFVLANLLVVAGFTGVLVLFGFLVSKDSSKQAWSDYTPKGSDVIDKAQNMVNHVAPKYRYGGAPIAVVQAQPLLYRDAVVDGIAFAKPPLRQVGGGFTDFQSSDSTIAYVFCGQAQRCALPQSEAVEIEPLLARESLELALYTFKYVDGVDSVTVILPPLPGGQTPPSAVFLKRGDVKSELSKPLSQTLAPITPTIGTIKATELQTLNRITRPRLYQVGYTQAQDASPVLILSPVP